MYAIFRSGSKQYRVKKGDVIRVELLKQAPGEAVEFRDVLYIADTAGKVRVGAPTVSGCTVKAEYLDQVKGPKIHAVKYKRRKNQVRKFGHRQRYSEVKIVDITG
jgi:large subunit ribosomal protein L21